MSRFARVIRLVGMTRTSNRAWRWLGGVVLAHLAISVVHGTAHAGGLVWALRSARIGAWLIGLTMAASLVFGLVNHFVLASADHVSHVEPRWQPLFATTAVLLSITEVLGLVLAVRLARERSLA
jgi:hypothetical protein